MKRNIITDLLFCTALAFAATSCAEMPESYDNDNEIRYIDKWVELYNRELKEKDPSAEEVVPTGKGIYILEEKLDGNGRVFQEKDYVIMDYDILDLEGNIIQTTDKETALKVGIQFNSGDYFGALVFAGIPELTDVGLIESFKGMQAGSCRDVLIPSWLRTKKKYDTAAEYRKHKTGNKTYIYSMKVRAVADDYKSYQDELMTAYLPQIGLEKKDTINAGFYYKTLEKFPEKAAADKNEEEKKDTSFTMINYTGTLLSKDYTKAEAPVATQIFDTTDERLAKDSGIYNSKNTYSVKKVVWGEKAEEIKLEGSSVISGFYRTLWKMKQDKAKRAIAVFGSDLGYGRQGNGRVIPGYAPLVFEIERTEE